MACRFPGAPDVDAFWRLLHDGIDAVTEIPRQRFDIDAVYDPRPGTAGKIYCRQGGFLEGVEDFDAAFFGISPREATRMDPQQRLLTEVAWEALEDAGQRPHSAQVRSGGIFVGVGAAEYLERASRRQEMIDLHLVTGGTAGVAAGRLAHTLGLAGPSLAIDSDRSASLVAVHLACRSLRSGECSLALAGGVNLILLPKISIAFSQAKLLAPDGRCKSFDARANGFGRSEGVGLVVLKPLARAREDGDLVYAVIRGSAVNNDGGSSGLLLNPSRSAQQSLLRSAWRDAGLVPGEADYVEAHGTGTAVGDETEALALGEVLAEGRPAERACALGSVKSNIGHAEAAAGIAGLIKTVLCLWHRKMVPSLHFQTPNQRIPWRELPLRVQTELGDWPSGAGPPRAGVSSFGLAGTNAHVVLEAVSPPPRAAHRPAAHLFPLSATSPAALVARARAEASLLASGGLEDEGSAEDLCCTAALRRAHHPCRLALVARSRRELHEALESVPSWLDEGMSDAPSPVGERRKVVFVFSGQGSQWLGMGRELLAAEPVFRRAVERCAGALRAAGSVDVAAALRNGEVPEHAKADVVQPVLFAFQVGLAELWRWWGVAPDAVIGQSMGEVAAAAVAGALDLAAAARVVGCRSRRVGALGPGAMATVALPAATAGELLPGFEDRVAVAVAASPASSVLSGDPAAVDEILAGLEVFHRRISVDYASHSPHVDPILEPLRNELGGFTSRPPSVPMYSTVTGGPIDGDELDADYWTRNLRQPVLFAPALGALLDDGHSIFIELSPHPIVLSWVRETIDARGDEGMVLPSLRRSEGERATMLAALGALYGAGQPICWERLFTKRCRGARLAPYPWQRRRFWIEDELPPADPSPRIGPEPARAPAEEASSATPLAAASGAERRRLSDESLRRAVGQVLRLAPGSVEPTRSLIRMGLDSLLALELRHRLERRLGIAVSVAELLRDRSLRALGEQLAERFESSAPAAATPHGGGEGREEFGLSPGQKALWFIHRLAPENPAYNIAIALRVRSPLELGALRRVLDALVERHAALRTTFHAPSGEPVQRVRESLPVDFSVVDAAACSGTQLDQHLQRERCRAYDLENGPLLRATVFSLSRADHVLVLGVHHIYSDFWSIEVLVRELGTRYEQEIAGEPAVGGGQAIEPSGLGFCDYVRWQQELLAGPEGDRLEAYWREQLAGAPPELELLTDRPRPPVQTYRGAYETRRLGLCGRLRRLAREHGATLFTTVVAAFQTLLHRYSGQQQLLLGTMSGGRSAAAFAGTVGYFVNPLVLRGDLSGDPSFADFLARTRQLVLAAFEHQDYPFPLLVEGLNPERDRSRSPLFQVAFVWHQARGAALPESYRNALLPGRGGARTQLGGLAVESMSLELGGAQFDLTLMVAEAADHLAASLHYNPDLFDATTIRRMAGHLATLLAGIVRESQRRVSELPLVAGPERQQLLIELNDTAAGGDTLSGGSKSTPPAATIVRWFEQQAAATPEATAVTAAATAAHLSYGELNARANQLARDLSHQRAGRGALVGVCAERSPEMVVAVVGILKAGAAYLPLDPTYPRERLTMMVEEARPPVLLTRQGPEEELCTAIARPGTTVIPVDRRWPHQIARRSPHDPPAGGPTALDLAYVIYTSGSTGRPKGIALPHLTLNNLIAWHLAERPAGAGLLGGARTLQYAALSFDISIYEMFVTWCSGGTLVLVPDAARHDPGALAGLLSAAEIVKVILPVVVLQRLAEECLARDLDPRLGEITTSGEQLRITPAIVDFFQRFGPMALHNHYGPAETHVVTAHALPPAPRSWRSQPSIGRPIARTEIYLLSPREMQPVPLGVAGELFVGGASLARGYLHRPARTAEKFLPHPFAGQGGERLYRTGDLARYRSDGTLDFLGRCDHQVKIRGFRVELGEIEAVLQQHPAVTEAVVLLSDEGTGGPRLVAYAAVEAPEEPISEPVPGASELRGFLRRKLPGYMVPAAIALLDALPQTPSGKIDRRALPAPKRIRAEREAAFVAPGTETERIIAGVWREVLGCADEICVEDSFFDAGGHSLLLAQVSAGIRRHLGLEVPVVDLFEYTTIRALARYLNGEDAHSGARPRTPPASDADRGKRWSSVGRQRQSRLRHRMTTAD